MTYITVENNQVLKVDRTSISSSVHCFQITQFIFASIVSWVYLNLYLFERLPLHKSQTTGLMASPFNLSVFHWMHQFALVVKDLKFYKNFLIMCILDWLTLYVSLIIYLCQTSKSCFYFQYFSTSLFACIFLDHSYQIWPLKFNEQLRYTLAFSTVNIKRYLCFYFHKSC